MYPAISSPWLCIMCFAIDDPGFAFPQNEQISRPYAPPVSARDASRLHRRFSSPRSTTGYTALGSPKLVLVDEMPESAQSVDEDLLLERDAALRAIASLSDAERRLIARTYFRGMTAREISEDDGIPLGTVKTRLRAALIKVRKANAHKEYL